MQSSAPSKRPPARRAATEPSSRVQSLVRAFAILETVARSREGIGLSDLARAIGLHSSTVFNLARTMTDLRYLDQSPDDRRYRIGRAMLSLGASAVDDLLLVNKARAVIEDLSRVSGESGTFAVWTGDQVVAMARSSGGGSFQLSDRVGGARPAHATATGKVLLAALPPEQLETYVGKEKLERFTPRTIVDPRRLIAEVKRVREAGMAMDQAEYRDDVCCLAMPVRDFSGKVVGAMGLSGPIWRMTKEARAKKAILLGKAARQLSQELGHGGLSDTFSPAMDRLVGTSPGKDGRSGTDPRPAGKRTTAARPRPVAPGNGR
jgi:IclR family KDG regulon transcriptional repressor